MSDYREILTDSVRLTGALKSIPMSAKERADMELLYNAKLGLPVERDKGNRVRGPSVHSCSQIGSNLTRHFGGVGPGDKMMWVGHITPDAAGNELWVMRKEIRSAMRAAGIAGAS